MTALERALVVYAEAKGYEIEVEYRLGFWKNKQYEGKFDFGQCEYRIKNREDYRKTYDELSDFFKPLYTPDKKQTWTIEDLIKYDAPEGFFCKTVTLTREEIEEMNKTKKSPFETDSPEVRERYAKVTPFILLMEAWAEGEDIEYNRKSEKNGTWDILDGQPVWDFCHINYRIAPKQPEAIPATEEELEEIKAEKNSCFWVKDKISGITWKFSQMGVDILESFYILNLSTKCWEDWSSK